MFGFSPFSKFPFSVLQISTAPNVLPQKKPYYIEGVKVKKRVAEVVKEDIIDYDEELAILMLMVA